MTDELLPCFCGFEKQQILVWMNHQPNCPAYYRSVVAEDKKKAVETMREKCADTVPTNWLDPLLTGHEKALWRPPYGCPDVERLLSAIAAAIRRIEGE